MIKLYKSDRIKNKIPLTVIICALIFLTAVSLCMQESTPAILYIAENSIEDIADILNQAEIYRRFFDEPDETPDFFEVSENLRKAIKIAEEIAGKKSNSEYSQYQIENAVNQFNEAAENFRAYYFDSGKYDKIWDSDLIDKLYIGGVKCAYDEKSMTFFYTMGQTPDREFRFDFEIESGFESNVFAEIYDPDRNKTDYRFIPEFNKEYILKSYSKNIMFEYKIIFTMLPVIQIDNINRIGDTARGCIISVTDPDFSYTPYSGALSHMFIETSATIRIRGGISRGFPKKSYAVTFVDETGEDKDMKFFGMRNDSGWILDAMYIDKARMRNRISTDIWNDFNSELYYIQEGMKPQSNGTHGVFVEVFLGDEYRGLYCFTEKIDRKQLQLLKLLKNDGGTGMTGIVKSVIYKGRSWDEPILFNRYPKFRENNRYWGGFEQKYPNPDKGGTIYWDSLSDFVYFAVNSTDKDFAQNIDKYIDMGNFVDYTLLMLISYAVDNTGKNCYWSIYDVENADMSKIFITPWDLDATWGRSWESSKTSHKSAYDWMYKKRKGDSNLFRRLLYADGCEFAGKLQSRWDELKDNVLSPENLANRFDAVFDLFDKSGAWNRESGKWRDSDLNLEYERRHIRDWIFNRWDYIDGFIKNLT